MMKVLFSVFGKSNKMTFVVQCNIGLLRENKKISQNIISKCMIYHVFYSVAKKKCSCQRYNVINCKVEKYEPYKNAVFYFVL